jgi:hypothetical protein
MTERYCLIERVATPAEYRALCTAVGWEGIINFEAATPCPGRSMG